MNDHALKKRMDMGFTFLKMDLGIGLLLDEPGCINAPLGFIDDMKKYASHILNVQGGSVTADMVRHQKSYDIVTTAHPHTGIHLTEKGLDYLENYIKEVREVIGYEVPLAIDHFGHVCVEDCIKFARRMEPYNLAWIEDMVPWMYTDQYVRLKNSTTIPVCTGEDIYLKEGFETLIKAGGVSVIHPDILTCGGALELKKIADIADENGVAPEKPEIIELEVNNHNFVKEFEVFGDAIVNGTDVPTPVEEGAKTVAACLAIVESANTGKIVKPDYNF